MKYYAALAVSAAILAAAPAFAGGPVMRRATPAIATASMRHMEVRHQLRCAKSFHKANYPGATYESYSCTTPFISCPAPDSKAVIGFIEPRPAVKAGQTIRFSYRCVYEKNPG